MGKKLNPIIGGTAAIVLSLSVFGSAKAAITITGAVYSVTDYNLFEGTVPGPGLYTDSNSPFTYTATLAATPTPSIRLQMISSGPGTGAINASIIYDYHISGPTTQSGLVPAQVMSQLWATASGGDAGASLTIPGFFPTAPMVLSMYAHPALPSIAAPMPQPSQRPAAVPFR
jgi:hypothetical protein